MQVFALLLVIASGVSASVVGRNPLEGVIVPRQQPVDGTTSDVGASVVGRSPLDGVLVSRQASANPDGFPSVCSAQCTDFKADAARCGTDNACFCTTKVAGHVKTCLNCVAAAEPSTIPTLQSAVDEAVNTCQQSGHHIPSITVKASTGNGALRPGPSSRMIWGTCVIGLFVWSLW